MTSPHLVKPIGAFSPQGAPPWISFGSIASFATDAEIAAAVAQSRATGFRWIVQLGFDVPATTPAGPVAAAARARLEALGLWPWVAALTWGEEWYERWYGNEFAPFGFPASHPDGLAIIHDWFGRQHRAIQAATGRPVIWLTGMVYGPRAVPAGTDYVALDPYPRDDQPFAEIEAVYAHAETETPLPIIMIPRWFRNAGPTQGPHWRSATQAPRIEVIDGYGRIYRRPRVAAVWGFLWASRPSAELVGLADMPISAGAVLQSFGGV